MLQINMADVIAVLNSIAPHLIAIGIVLALAVIITVAVNRRTVADTATRKLVHAESWLAVMVAAVAAVSMMLFGPLATLLNNASTERYMLSGETVAAANDLAEEVQSEGITLLKNDDGNLPLQNTKVNVFGWASTNPVYGGTGSGSMNATYPTVSVLQGMANAGLETNEELSEFYTDYRADRPVVGFWDPDWTLPEPPASSYGEELMGNARDFSDQAVIVITRVGGEMADLPTDMTADGVIYTDNSTEYADFAEGEHILQLSQSERDMVDLVTSNFENVTFVYNGANAFELGFVDDYPQIKSVIWCPPAGQTGFTALGEILAGTVNPSGKTSDTFVYDLTATPTWNNFGDFHYDNMDDYAVDYLDFRGVETHNTPTFVNYVEGIYVGYRYYETAADEGAIDYESTVQYPFGYGLSYTTFSQEMGDVTYSDGTVSFDVTVTNTGDVAGKDVVEVYYNPPYVNGGIEKASANLVAFDKTDELEPGESQTVSISFDDDDMASYDENDAQAWVLEAGDYGISIRSDSHNVLDEATVTVPETITYDSEDNTHNGDQTVATNQFGYAEGDVTYLSRADHFANYDEATAAPATYSMSEESMAMFLNNDNYDPTEYDDPDDAMPTTGADNGVRLADLRGADYDDPQWDQLLDQLTFDEMDNLIANGGYGNAAIDSIGKIALVDLDGPAALNNNFTGVGSIGFPASVAFACTWNVDLATEFGDMMGRMARELNATGWYAPSINNHRSAFAGRNFEYFSEDPTLAGVMASGEVAGAQAQGVYAFVKHFALNDQEANRQSMLCTWATEQSIREIYMKPFEITVKDGGTTAIMSAYNYIGPVYAGASANLLTTVLRDEWGYQGVVISDYFLGQGYQNADQMVRAGNDFMLATTDITNHITDESATSVIAMRQATKNLLYTAVNSWAYENGEPESATPIWQTITYVVIGVAAVLFVGLEVLAVKRYLSRRAAARNADARG
ncbi:glycoside hydrolase family 3 N-terminal domain-containing protein [Bifidobacterium phasiani]|uniref:Glycoside hydrolase family 3 C-terminal domain-containing protein n=1 Tax=Bifidobacterium phasiani TaxID=2834431 RepID=A0ABS6WBI6_9BIFI|nr:glycoside hydrolase family 3 N-terminal domain-containing protein [Bifidobacterium phasiani]MBW3083429.1 glycoside hydrolase family 3 C-terminal domain-containing protein [Bifidobacterium phasiani]